MDQSQSSQFEVHDQEVLAKARSIMSETEVAKDVGAGGDRGGQEE